MIASIYTQKCLSIKIDNIICSFLSKKKETIRKKKQNTLSKKNVSAVNTNDITFLNNISKDKMSNR